MERVPRSYFIGVNETDTKKNRYNTSRVFAEKTYKVGILVSVETPGIRGEIRGERRRKNTYDDVCKYR